MAVAPSGVKCGPGVVEEFKAVKLGKTRRYVIMHIKDKFIEVESTKDRNPDMDQEEEFKEFLSALPMDNDRYCIVDLTCPQNTGTSQDKLFLIMWCPSSSTPKAHILYTMSQAALLHYCKEGCIQIQANDLADLDYDELIKRGRK